MIGHIVSHYRVLQKLGGGGMGVVYRAEDLKLRRTVALKFLAPELTRDEDAKKRFLHEAQAASALDHPNICAIHEIDETPEGQLFIAMTCYDGESLKERIARRRVEVEEAFQIAFAVAQGLGRAHASSIIHRDIKPGNVMITNDGFVKIIDFGLSKLIGRSRVTGSGATLGTVAYMSPEQARSEEVDARADIWALGAILYEMLTARVPFRGEIDQAVVYSILNENPVPIRELRADVPEVCAAIVMKCLAKDPAARYQSAEDFCVAVFEAGKKLGWGDSFATAAVRAVSMVRGRERKRRTLNPALIAALVVALAATLWLAWKNRSVSPYSTGMRVALSPFERVGDTPPQALVDGMYHLAGQSFERASRARHSMWVLPAERVAAYRPATIDRFRTTFGVNRVVTGRVSPFETGHTLVLSLRDPDTQQELQRETVSISLHRLDAIPALIDGAVARLAQCDSSRIAGPAMAGTRPEVLVATMTGWGILSRPGGAGVDEEIDRLRNVVGADTSFVPGVAVLGELYLSAYDATEDERHAREARKWLESWKRADSASVDVRLALGRLFSEQGRTDRAIAQFEDCARRDPGNLVVSELLGRELVREQRYDEAEAVFQALVDRVPDYYHAHWQLASLYRKSNQPERELLELQRVLELAPDDYRALNNMGIALSDRGEWSRARENWERAFLIRPSCANCSNVAYVLYFEQRFKDAARYYEFALEHCDTTSFVTWANLASALYRVEDQRERSIGLYHRAIALGEKHLEEVPDDAVTAAWLADFNAMIGNRDEALRLVELARVSNEGEVLYRIAGVYEQLGDRVQALHYIGEAIRQSYLLYEIMNEPTLQDLVKDPRFLQLLESEQKSAKAE
jgi:tetratricopeptide (TPR) repeat protein